MRRCVETIKQIERIHGFSSAQDTRIQINTQRAGGYKYTHDAGQIA